MDEVSQEGYNAYAEGTLAICNPYDSKDPNWLEWKSGWDLAKEDYQEYLEKNSPLREEDYDA